MPWLTLLAAALAFWAWAIYGDVVNHNSDLRTWWRQRRRVFEVVAVPVVHTWDYRSPRDTERVEIRCILRFFQEALNPILNVRVTSPLGIQAAPARTRLIINRQLGQIVPQDAEYNILLGSIAITRPMPKEEREQLKLAGLETSARHNVWGETLGAVDIAQGQTTMIPGSRNLIEISIGSHTYRILIQLIQQDLESLRHVCVITEDEYWTQ